MIVIFGIIAAFLVLFCLAAFLNAEKHSGDNDKIKNASINEAYVYGANRIAAAIYLVGITIALILVLPMLV